MKERLKLVNGLLSSDSKPQHGTTIFARVPLEREPASSKRLRKHQETSLPAQPLPMAHASDYPALDPGTASDESSAAQ
jgi:hypothetical protein